MSMFLETGAPPRFRLVGVDREGFVIAAAGVGDVIDAAPQRAVAPAIENIEGERRMDADHGMQRRRQRPCLEADAGYELAGTSGVGERQGAAVAGDDMAGRI